MNSQVNWVQLARRTEPPKLTWLIKALERAGVMSRLNGASFHAPILEVPGANLEHAQLVLGPVDDLPDDDPMFGNTRWARAWWVNPPRVGDLAVLTGALGILANRVRRAIADTVRCVPVGADPHSCPLATGAIRQCPGGLWSACRPMVRIETFLVAVAEQLSVDGPAAIARCEELVEAIHHHARDRDPSTSLIAFCHVLSLRMSEGRLGRVVKLAKRPSSAVVADVMRETVEVSDTVLPRRVEIVGGDVIARAAEGWRFN